MVPNEREKRTKGRRCCNISFLICVLFALLWVVALFFVIWPVHTTTLHDNVTRLTRDDHSGHRPTDNVSLIPHTHDKTVLMRPVPAGANVTMCALLSWQYLTMGMTSMTKWCNDSYFLQRPNWRTPAHFSNLTNLTNAEGIHVGRRPERAALAFSRECKASIRPLGNSQAQEVISIPSWNTTGRNLDHRWGIKDNDTGFVMNIFTLNVSVFLVEQNYALTPNKNWTKISLLMPGVQGFPAPQAYVWVCGKRVFLYLPEEWCGICHLAKLAPSIKLVDFQVKSASTLHKRSFTPPTRSNAFGQNRDPLISDGRGIIMTLLPWYGAAYLGHRLNEVWWTLEDLTDALSDITTQLRDNPETRAMRAMLVSHQLALDYLFASDGGLCAKFGDDHCCTYIPESTANWTLIHDRVADLKTLLTSSHDSTRSNFNLSSWFTSGTWLQILFKIFTPVLIVLCLFCLFTTCVFPCIRALFQRLIDRAVSPINTMLAEQVHLLVLDPDDDLPDDDPGHR